MTATTTIETLTPAAVAALSDGALNELAHRLIVGGGFPHNFTVQDGEHDYCEACGEKDTTDKSCRFGPDYAASDDHAFTLVDALRVCTITGGLSFLDKITIEYYPATEKWCVNLRLQRNKPVATQHQSRARAITEAAVLAAMALREGK